MHEYFQRDGSRFRYPADLIQREFTCQHYLRKAGSLEKANLFRRAIIRLRAGVKRDRRQVQPGNPHILYDQGICSGMPKIPDHPFGFLQLLFFQDRVERNVDTGSIQVGIIAKLAYIFQRIAGSGTRTELGRTDIDRIGTVINRFHPTIKVFSRRKKFYRTGFRLHAIISYFLITNRPTC